jgi:hypothetical protein
MYFSYASRAPAQLLVSQIVRAQLPSESFAALRLLLRGRETYHDLILRVQCCHDSPVRRGKGQMPACRQGGPAATDVMEGPPCMLVHPLSEHVAQNDLDMLSSFF